MLAYIIWGHRVPELKRHFEGAGEGWSSRVSRLRNYGSYRRTSRSGNFAFDEYRENELKRLDEERRRLDEERREFEAYVHDLRRARDKEEFDRFMADRTARRNNGEPKAAARRSTSEPATPRQEQPAAGFPAAFFLRRRGFALMRSWRATDSFRAGR